MSLRRPAPQNVRGAFAASASSARCNPGSAARLIVIKRRLTSRPMLGGSHGGVSAGSSGSLRRFVEGDAQMTAEHDRLEAARRGEPWKQWGPYLSERQWGTVREDYSSDGNAWSYFSHDQARSRAYRWGE